MMNYQEMKKRVDQLCELIEVRSLELYKKSTLLHKVADRIKELLKHRYARLMRLHSPTGFLLLFIPVFWAVILVSKGFFSGLYYTFLALLGALIMRSAGCVINDIVDLKYDPDVERTSSRPLASGEVTLKEAYYIIAGLLSLALLLLITLQEYSIGYITLVLASIITYPFLKRYTNYAQVFLGLIFNSGVMIMWFAISPNYSFIGFLLYIASAIWTIAYDTVYAYQDLKDDTKLGLKSMAIKLGEKSNHLIWKMYQTSMLLISIVGLAKYLNIFFFIGMALLAYQLYPHIISLDLKSRESCNKFFNMNVKYGFLISIIFLVGMI